MGTIELTVGTLSYNSFSRESTFHSWNFSDVRTVRAEALIAITHFVKKS